MKKLSKKTKNDQARKLTFLLLNETFSFDISVIFMQKTTVWISCVHVKGVARACANI